MSDEKKTDHDSQSSVSYASSSSEDDLVCHDNQDHQSSQPQIDTKPRLKSLISKVDPSVVSEIEEQAKSASKSIEKLMKFLSKELQNGSKATENIVTVYDGAINNVYVEVEGNIKAMYSLIAKCEELDRKMKPIAGLAEQVRNIRESLDTLELVCGK